MSWSAAGCSICSESMTKIVTPPPDAQILPIPNNVNTMVTPCGHAYHAVCISRWMARDAERHGSCPNCRKVIPNKRAAPLYLDTSESSIMDSTVVENMSSHISSVRKELDVVTSKRQQLESTVNSLFVKYDMSKQTIMDLKKAFELEKAKSIQKCQIIVRESESHREFSEAKIEKAQKETKEIQEKLDKVQRDFEHFKRAQMLTEREKIGNDKAINEILENARAVDKQRIARLQEEVDQLNELLPPRLRERKARDLSPILPNPHVMIDRLPEETVVRKKRRSSLPPPGKPQSLVLPKLRRRKEIILVNLVDDDEENTGNQPIPGKGDQCPAKERGRPEFARVQAATMNNALSPINKSCGRGAMRARSQKKSK